jgi:hypothetical protein
MIHKFQLVKNRVVPRDARIIEQAAPSSKLIVVSDIVPTDAIDATFMSEFSAGTITFGDVDWANYPDGAVYIGYSLIKVGRDRRDGFTRLYFADTLTDAEKYTPYDTEEHSKDIYWPNVLERWRADPDPTRSVQSYDVAGNESFEMQWRARYILKPYLDTKTRIERLLYVAPTKFQLQNIVPMALVSFEWKLPGDRMDAFRCLIDRPVVRPDVVFGPVAMNSTRFKPTFPSNWVRHLHDTDQNQLENGMYQMWEDFAIPPVTDNRIIQK